MKTETKKIENSKYEIFISLDKEEFGEYIEKAFEEEVKKVQVDGFRKGKVPRSVFDKKFGEGALFPTATELALSDVYFKVVVDEKINVIADPDFDFANAKISNEGLEITGQVAVMPEVEVGDYKELSKGIEKEEVVVKKEEIEEQITNILTAKSTFELKEEGSVEEGDTVIFDFEGFVDGESFEGGKAENYELKIGSKQFIPGFEEQLIGMKSDEQKDVIVTFPTEYPEESLQGKEATFKCHIHEIKTQVLPEITEELLSEIEGYDAKDKESLEKEVEQKLKDSKIESADRKHAFEIFTKVIEDANFEVPQEMIARETNQTLENFKNQIKSQGIEFELYIQMMGTTEEALKEDIDKESKRKIEEMLILNSVISKDNIEISDEEVDNKLSELASQYDMEKEQLESMIGGKDRLIEDLKYEKAYNTIIGK